MIAAAILAFAPSNHYLFLPDPARAVEPLVHIAGEKDRPGKGGIYMVDVVVRRASILERYFPGLHEGATLVPAEVLNPTGVSESERRKSSLNEMSNSQQIAAAVALRYLGYDVQATADGAEVDLVLAGAPAQGKLEPGDIITRVDDTTVKTPEDLRAAMDKVEPGETVSVTVKHSGGTRTLEIGTRADPETPGRAVVGIYVQLATNIKLPISVKVDSGSIGGPSAGLAFALDIVDEIGPRDIDRGKRIAVTGEINLAGQVGEIGGIKQKTIGAREAGADVFLVPVANAPSARKYAEGLRIVAVSSLTQALRVLATL
ncbi:MAG: S16 family serine protease [Gaiellaceae bacterium]